MELQIGHGGHNPGSPPRRGILLVEGSDSFRQSLVEQIKFYAGIEVFEAATGSAALKLVENREFDIILLDVSLPDLDGRNVYHVIRRRGVETPVVLLIESETEIDSILRSGLGADQYIVKPFRLGMLLARIRSLLNSRNSRKMPDMVIGRDHFEPERKLLVDHDTNHHTRLTEKETSILEVLYLAQGKLVQRSDLLDRVWGYSATVTTHTLETHIYRLRQKLEDVPSNSKILITELGGYRLNF